MRMSKKVAAVSVPAPRPDHWMCRMGHHIWQDRPLSISEEKQLVELLLGPWGTWRVEDLVDVLWVVRWSRDRLCVRCPARDLRYLEFVKRLKETEHALVDGELVAKVSR